jgi:hypothetical protein
MQSQSLQTAHPAQLQHASVGEEGKKGHIATEGMSSESLVRTMPRIETKGIGKSAYLVQLLLLSFQLFRFHLQSLGLIKRLLRLRPQPVYVVLGSERLLYKSS